MGRIQPTFIGVKQSIDPKYHGHPSIGVINYVTPFITIYIYIRDFTRCREDVTPQTHNSVEQWPRAPGQLLCMRDYTSQLYRDCNKP